MKEIKNEVSKQYENEKQESQNKMLQQQVSELPMLNLDIQENNDELEQYKRRFCFRVEDVPTKDKQSDEDKLDLLKRFSGVVEVDVCDDVVDQSHRIGRT